MNEVLRKISITLAPLLFSKNRFKIFVSVLKPRQMSYTRQRKALNGYGILPNFIKHACKFSVMC
jgi:hypothetical protein